MKIKQSHTIVFVNYINVMHIEISKYVTKRLQRISISKNQREMNFKRQ